MSTYVYISSHLSLVYRLKNSIKLFETSHNNPRIKRKMINLLIPLPPQSSPLPPPYILFRSMILYNIECTLVCLGARREGRGGLNNLSLRGIQWSVRSCYCCTMNVDKQYDL